MFQFHLNISSKVKEFFCWQKNARHRACFEKAQMTPGSESATYIFMEIASLSFSSILTIISNNINCWFFLIPEYQNDKWYQLRSFNIPHWDLGETDGKTLTLICKIFHEISSWFFETVRTKFFSLLGVVPLADFLLNYIVWRFNKVGLKEKES